MKRWMIVCALIGSSIGSLAMSHEGATGVVSQRIDAMDAISEANRTLMSIARGRSDFDLETVQSAATTIADHAGQSLIDLFPEDSVSEDSEAKPDIWQSFDRFTELSLNLESTARTLSQIESEDSFKAQFDAMSKNCGNCHRSFREKKR